MNPNEKYDKQRAAVSRAVAGVLNEQYGCNAEPSAPLVDAVMDVLHPIGWPDGWGVIERAEPSLGGVNRIAAERCRQQTKKRWTADHDDGHTDESIAVAASVYAMPYKMRQNTILGHTVRLTFWPRTWAFRGAMRNPPTPEERIQELSKAGALIAAEIDRLERDAEETR